MLTVNAYLSIARPDHWFKNIFMALGVLLALFIEPNAFVLGKGIDLVLAVLATCLIASSNYVINEILDAPTDKVHPFKRMRPIPSGRVRLKAAYAEWLALAFLGFYVARQVNDPFFISTLVFWLSAIFYNVPPLRTKDIPYVDVLTESLNNPIRLFLGWFVLIPDRIPPLSLTMAYWMAGAFFMGAKRFAEYRMLNDPVTAGNYRNSFRYYDSDKLLTSQFFYACACCFFFGIFAVRYHLELILAFPLYAGFFSYYMKLSVRPGSPAQTPEKLQKEYKFVVYVLASFLAFVFLLFTRIPTLYAIFNVIPHKLIPLWTIE